MEVETIEVATRMATRGKRISHWLMYVERWIHSFRRKWSEQRAEDASNAAAMALLLLALIGRYTRPGVRNAALFCKHMSQRGMQAANSSVPLSPSPLTLSAHQHADQISVLGYRRKDDDEVEEMRLELK
jgi:hypothetical protein